TEAADALGAGLKGVKACRPLARVLQRRYKTQRSVPVRDALVDFDLRTVAGGQDPALGRPVKKQSEWAELAYGLLSNKRSNMQFQIGVQFEYSRFGELADRD